MRYTGYELLWLFFTVSFFGWLLETIYAALRKKKLVNRGLVNGPLCIIYGISAAANAVFLQEMSPFWVFVGSATLATVIEWSAGHILERFGNGKWWNYSGVKWNLDGYICLPASFLWGVLGASGVLYANDWIVKGYHYIPRTAGILLLWITLAVVCVDIAATLVILSGKSRVIQKWRTLDSWFAAVAAKMENGIYSWISRRIQMAHPQEASLEIAEKQDCFAYGCSFYKIVLLFIIGAFLGDIVETIFCRIKAGVWMSRSSLVWGPFSIVWGFAIAAVTVLLYRCRNYSDRFLFLTGTVLGGAYEYLCSVLTELVFGTVFWDYSQIPFNLGGRINLLYCIFWGIAAVVWFKELYPRISDWIERLPKRGGKITTWFLLIFMCVNMAVSGLALIRSSERSIGIAAETVWQQVMDERFDDERLMRIYPNMMRVE